MCTVLLPPGDNPIAVNKYIISERLSACMEAVPAGRISVKFGFGEFCENLSRNSVFG